MAHLSIALSFRAKKYIFIFLVLIAKKVKFLYFIRHINIVPNTLPLYLD